MIDNEKLNQFLQVCNFIAQKDLCPATAGNFSIRLDESQMLVSGSGRDKSNLTPHDFVICDLNANLISGDYRPSDEAILHGKIYALSPNTTCVLHTHSIPTTVLSMIENNPSLLFSGYEMQKTIEGHNTHESFLKLAILDNSQDVPSIALKLQEDWSSISNAKGFIIKGHGLYSWGTSIAQAKKHMEGLEFLIACALERKRIEKV